MPEKPCELCLPVGLAYASVSECGAAEMFWRLWAYWQTLDDNANRRCNLATSLFTLGIKLKNTTSNFIPGFPHYTSQCDIYLLVRCPFFLSLTPPFTLLTDNTEQKTGKVEGRKIIQLYTVWKYWIFAYGISHIKLKKKLFLYSHTWKVIYFSALLNLLSHLLLFALSAGSALRYTA